MDLIIILAALGLLIFVAYRGFSVIIFAPICALLAVFLTEPSYVLPFFSNIFMEKMVGFVKLYFPVFLLGAIFGKVIEMTGIAERIAKVIVRFIGAKQAILTVVLMGAILTYSGVSLFVVVFAIYPFAAQLFREANIPKRLMPATIAFSAFTFSMDAIPGSPQIQNVIPTSFFNTTIYAAPALGMVGAGFIFVSGMVYLESRRRKAAANGEGYYGKGENAISEIAATSEMASLPAAEISKGKINAKDWFAFLSLVLVGVMNKFFTTYIPKWYENGFDFAKMGLDSFGTVNMNQYLSIWSVVLALLIGVLTAIALNFNAVKTNFRESMNAGISGALLATMNTASEFGFGGIIAALPGFTIVQNSLSATFTNPLVNGAVTTNVLAGITGSGSGGISITLGVMAEKYVEAANAFNIPLEVMHRVMSMAAGGMDTLPHNGAVITLLLVCGLTHRQAYKDIFAITVIKTLAAFLIIGVYMITGLV
ncbi:H+/gluconate symporter family protein [Schinkia azotoformans MEV2011]|uniref:H+/gluconate symporter family protein n=1 Tax=Schinkia azotoformans MEV2011 TaxID=1348973 RepID=A0A072P2E6_SCHAZ|nr:GntP family permease [Schinkia azotoformans]KEF39635.1 H+/gluconate symporter family protein [Schinkia azotoformans MEV2011]MEC1695092.1 GntP family permease [Schinkia azotoformans]MEC1726897.1 GntP family permease [Schinkia azotoformans]